MLDYKIINYKPLITKDGNTYIDLLASTYDGTNIGTGTVIIVEKMYVARPDLISLAVYGTDEYGDLLCKVNGISNPFELNENDILFCPSPDIIIDAYKYNSVVSDIIKNPDDNIGVKFSSFQRPKNSKRLPNEQIDGENNFVIDKSLGLVFY